ncbi:LamG-like jellyroll fold domain-containing protein [Micromonospora sp. NPDC049559]|uniref:LamG-like jellyroll fold domain-containing protein n=1 Tax=Micromonospora sp. NPDC049559 TaxID=3155923 RepID=UPI0034372ABA
MIEPRPWRPPPGGPAGPTRPARAVGAGPLTRAGGPGRLARTLGAVRSGRRWRSLPAALLAIVLPVGVAVVGVHRGDPATRPAVRYASAWLASRAIGALTLVDGVSAEVAATVPVAPPGSPFTVTQQGRAGYVTAPPGPLVRVDGATHAPRPVDVPSGELSALAGDDRYLWGLRRDGGLTRFADAPAVPRAFAPPAGAGPGGAGPAVTGSAGSTGGARRLVVTGAGPVLVDADARRAYLLSPERGEVVHELPVDIGPDDLVSGVPDGPWLLAVRPADATLLRCEVRADTCSGRTTLVGAGPELGAAVGARGAVFVPDRGAGVVRIVDLAGGPGAATERLADPGARVELSVAGGVVFLNDPDGPAAAVVAADGSARRLVKYGGAPPAGPPATATPPPTASSAPPGPSPRPGPTDRSASPTPSRTPSRSPTPSPSRTRTPSPTPSTPRNPYLREHDRLVLDDPMTRNTGRWSNDNDATGTCRFASDGYHVESSNGHRFHECYGDLRVEDFTYEVRFHFGTARAAGVFVRQSGDGSWYFAMIGRSGTVWLSKGVAGVPEDPDLFTGSVDPPDPNGWHRLAVTGVGDTLTVYVDGERVGSITDGQFDAGPIGVFTDGGRAPDGADPHGETIFRDVRVWRP